MSLLKVNCGKTSDWIRDGEWGQSRDGCIRWARLSSKGKGQFWGEFGASRCNQWGFCCVVVRVTCSSQITSGRSCYIRQVNGVKLADILLSLLSVCVSVRTQSSLQQCVSLLQRISHLPHATHLFPTHHPPQPTWRIYALSERLLVVVVPTLFARCVLLRCRLCVLRRSSCFRLLTGCETTRIWSTISTVLHRSMSPVPVQFTDRWRQWRHKIICSV